MLRGEDGLQSATEKIEVIYRMLPPDAEVIWSARSLSEFEGCGQSEVIYKSF